MNSMDIAAKRAEIKAQLRHDGYAEQVPRDKQLWSAFLRRLREATGLSGTAFWTLFGVAPSTGSKYEQKNPEHQRACPPFVMQRVAEILGIPFEAEPQADNVLKKVVGLRPDLKELLAYAYENNITLRDLHAYVEIRSRVANVLEHKSLRDS